MKAEAELGAIGYATPRTRASGVGIFAGGILTLLTIMVGVPLLMVVLMSLRTGFPGEGGPLTLANFITVYSAPSTYKILLNTLLFAFGTVIVGLAFAVPLVWLLNRTEIGRASCRESV